MKLFILKNGLPHNRIAFTFTRKYGNAVERNRSRRLSREVYRDLKSELITGYDFLLLAYPSEEKDDDFEDREVQLRDLFGRAGLFQNRDNK